MSTHLFLAPWRRLRAKFASRSQRPSRGAEIEPLEMRIAPAALITRMNGIEVPAANDVADELMPYAGIYTFSNSCAGGTLGNGAAPIVRIFDIANGVEAAPLFAYEKSYRQGVRVAVGDLNGDGFDDIVTATRSGTGRIRVFDGVTHQRLHVGEFSQIDAFTGSAAHGAYLALSDVDGDGRLDIIASSGLGGGTLKVFSGQTGSLLRKETPFGANYKGGIRVAGGDLNGDGFGDIITGQSSHGSKVKVFYSNGPEPVEFSAGGHLRDGVFLTAADLNGDGMAEIIVGQGKAGSKTAAAIGIFRMGSDNVPVQIQTIPLPSTTYRFGARVAAVDVNLDGVADILVGAGPMGDSNVNIFDGVTGEQVFTVQAFPSFPNLGVFVAGGQPAPLKP